MVDEPVYRVTWGANPAVITGKEGVREIHREQLAKLEAVQGENFWVLETQLAV